MSANDIYKKYNYPTFSEVVAMYQNSEMSFREFKIIFSSIPDYILNAEDVEVSNAIH